MAAMGSRSLLEDCSVDQKKDSKAKMVPSNAKKDFPRNIADFGKAGRKRVEG